jgi:hypothetical protein
VEPRTTGRTEANPGAKFYIDFDALVRETAEQSLDARRDYFESHVPYLARDVYLTTSSRPAEILQFRHGSFVYVFDYYTYFEETGQVPYSSSAESRLVVVCGRSSPRKRRRDDNRLRGWVGPTGRMYGDRWDKGHYIGHAIGGVVNGIEANVFVQRRALNRGWSKAGKVFRRMEAYCSLHAGTVCFARPVYYDGGSRPAWLQFGLLREDGSLWLEWFDNR